MKCDFQPLHLDEFLCKIAGMNPHQLTLEEFRRLVMRLSLSEAFINQHIRFKPDDYFWKLLLATDNIEIIVCCWLPGQKSKVHLHKANALNVSKVLRGTVTEEIYQEIGENIVLQRETEVSAGGFTTTERGQFHQLLNKSMQKAVTLHCYTPMRP